ncbi:Hypothetical protein Tcol_2341 [Trichococcus collinsii]|uniref:Uncharacterized protein n=1 Tax=Trichococcus collinsii TaxID=157076 RepID=A0AB38A228_9LACT|nr:Hypothetical protein Tcol_2341 [Trichococcus collinsii]SEA73997.1 hypothetical protein SAMN04488525_10524 [Trichococcus collinsii]
MNTQQPTENRTLGYSYHEALGSLDISRSETLETAEKTWINSGQPGLAHLLL